MEQVTIRELRAEDEQALKQFICKEFFTSEPMCKSMNVDPDKDGALWCDSVFPTCLKEGVSAVAIHHDTQELIGIRFAKGVYKDLADKSPFSKDDSQTRTLALLQEADKLLLQDMDFFEKYNVNKLVTFCGLCVAKSYQDKGIATKLVVKSLELIREKGFPLVTVESSGVYSAKIFENLGFQKLAQMNYEDFLIDGKPLEMTEDLRINQGFTLYIKLL